MFQGQRRSPLKLMDIDKGDIFIILIETSIKFLYVSAKLVDLIAFSSICNTALLQYTF